MGNTCTSRTKVTSALSEEEDSSDGEDALGIFEPRLGSTRSERYMRRIQQRVDMPESSNTQSTFFSGFESLLKNVTVYRPRLMICGTPGMGQSTHLAPALLHATEHLMVHSLDLPALYGVASKTPEEACAQVQCETFIGLMCSVISILFRTAFRKIDSTNKFTVLEKEKKRKNWIKKKKNITTYVYRGQRSRAFELAPVTWKRYWQIMWNK